MARCRTGNRTVVVPFEVGGAREFKSRYGHHCEFTPAFGMNTSASGAPRLPSDVIPAQARSPSAAAIEVGGEPAECTVASSSKGQKRQHLLDARFCGDDRVPCGDCAEKLAICRTGRRRGNPETADRERAALDCFAALGRKFGSPAALIARTLAKARGPSNPRTSTVPVGGLLHPADAGFAMTAERPFFHPEGSARRPV